MQGSAKSREQRPKQSVCHMRRLEAEANRSAARGPLTWQLGGRNVLPVLVGQLSEASQAAAVTQHGVPRDPVIWEVHASCGHGRASDRHCKPAGTGAPAHSVGRHSGRDARRREQRRPRYQLISLQQNNSTCIKNVNVFKNPRVLKGMNVIFLFSYF